MSFGHNLTGKNIGLDSCTNHKKNTLLSEAILCIGQSPPASCKNNNSSLPYTVNKSFRSGTLPTLSVSRRVLFYDPAAAKSPPTSAKQKRKTDVNPEFTGVLYRNFNSPMCVCFTLNRSFYSSTSTTPSGRADSFILERYKLCGHKTTTQAATLYQVDSRSAMPCHCAGL